jgi:hypothetical protein
LNSWNLSLIVVMENPWRWKWRVIESVAITMSLFELIYWYK